MDAPSSALPGLSVCARCVQAQGRACCEVGPGERLATLTFADMERIEEATGELRGRFVEREQLDDAAIASYEEARPLYRGLFAGGVRFGLKARRGACPFLERGAGCRLPPEAKPLACRLYPADFALDGTLTAVDAPHCQALTEAQSEAHLLALLGLTSDEVEGLRQRMLAEVAQHAAALRRR